MNAIPVVSLLSAFGAGLVCVRASRELVDRFLNLYSWDRAAAYGICGGIGVWAAFGAYCAPLLLGLA